MTYIWPSLLLHNLLPSIKRDFQTWKLSILNLLLKWTERLKMWEKYSAKEQTERSKYIGNSGGSIAAWRSWAGVRVQVWPLGRH